jgi:hypothetical protein
MSPTPEDHLVGRLAGRLDDPLQLGIVTLAFVEITVGKDIYIAYFHKFYYFIKSLIVA